MATATEQVRQWVNGGAQSGSQQRRTGRKAAKARDEQRRTQAAELLSLRWSARYRQSRASDAADKAAWRALVALLASAASVQAARVQLVAAGPSQARTAALLDELLADDHADVRA
jgi:hypothetical protein